jgi:hypothetical protein
VLPLLTTPIPTGTENIYKIYAESFKDPAPENDFERSPGDGEQSAELNCFTPRRRGRTTMSDASCSVGLIPFAPQYRSSGVLLHVTSQPRFASLPRVASLDHE